MNLGWKAINVNKNKGVSGAKSRPDRMRFCKICGNRTAVGSICQSCSEYLRKMKAREGRATS